MKKRETVVLYCVCKHASAVDWVWSFFCPLPLHFVALFCVIHLLIHIFTTGDNHQHNVMLQVCVRCIFRMFGAFSDACSCTSLTVSLLHSFLEEHDDSAKSGSCSCLSTDEACCSICFGILLPTCHQDDGVAPFDDVSRVDIITSMVSQAIQREGYQIDEFSLEISLPAVVAANERAIR